MRWEMAHEDAWCAASPRLSLVCLSLPFHSVVVARGLTAIRVLPCCWGWRRGDRLQLEAQLAGAAAQWLLQSLVHLLGVSRLGLLGVLHAITHQVVPDPRQLVRRRRDRLGFAQPSTLATHIGAEITFTA